LSVSTKLRTSERVYYLTLSETQKKLLGILAAVYAIHTQVCKHINGFEKFSILAYYSPVRTYGREFAMLRIHNEDCAV